MKKLIIIQLIVLYHAIASNVMALNYWDHELWNGTSMLQYFGSMPEMSGAELLSSDEVTGNNLSYSFYVDLSWYNFRRRGSSALVQGAAIIKEFSYSYNVGYTTSQGGTVNWFYSNPFEGKITNIPTDVPDEPVYNYSFSSKQLNYRFQKNLSIDISRLPHNQKYYIVVEFKAIPSKVIDEAGGSSSVAVHDGCALEDCYAKSQSLRLWKTATGVDVWFKRVISGNPRISYDMSVNPRYRTGTYEKNVVYNHPQAIVAVCLDTAKMAAKKIVGNTTYYPITMCCVGLGTETPISSNYSLKLPSGCWCKGGDGNVHNDDVLYLQDQKSEYDYLMSINALKDNSRARNRRLIICTREEGVLYDNALVSLHDESLVTSSGESNNNNGEYWVEWHYGLSDIVPQSGESSAVGTTFSIRNSAAYLTESTKNSIVNDPALYRMGYEFYGPSYGHNWFSLNADDFYYPKSENTLSFEVVPQAVFPRLSYEEKLSKRQCVTPLESTALTETDIIHLKGKRIESGRYSSTLYGAEYGWEVSFDAIHWQSVNSSAFKGYIVNVKDLDFALVVDEEKDVVLNSTILKNKEKVYFRQSAILRTFSDVLHSELYSYLDSDGRYYIKIDASDYYTYEPFSKLSDINFATYAVPEIQYVCKGEKPEYNYLFFDIRRGGLIDSKELEEMHEYLTYSVYRIYGDTAEILVSDENLYYFDYDGDTLHLRAQIELCHNILSRDFYVYPNPEEHIEIEDITSSARIATTDSNNASITILTLSGSSVDLTVGGNKVNATDYFIRKVLPNSYDEWHLFDSENTTVLEYDARFFDQSVYYIRKRNRVTGCYSDSVKVMVKYFQGIANNNISFSDARDSEKSDIYITSGSGNPAITGIVVSGGYGVPDSDINKCSYVYQWIYRPIRGVWQKISEFTDNGKSSVSVTKASLAADKIVVDRNIQIARIIYSRTDGDIATQVADTSNILTIYVENPIDIMDVSIVNNGTCAGTPVVIKLNEKIAEDNYTYVWSVDDDEVSIYTSGTNNSVARFDNTKSDFNVQIHRKNIVTGSVTSPILIPINVISLNPYFSIYVDGIEQRILDYPEETFHIQPGARVLLSNETEDCDIYQWTLEMQYYLNKEVHGTTSSYRNPVCYLYNAGQNKIMLTARNSEGCLASIVAENIYVNEGSTIRRSNSFFSDEDGDNLLGNYIESSQYIKVFPTVISKNGEQTVSVINNHDAPVYYMLYTLSGNLLHNGVVDNEVLIDFKNHEVGTYMLVVDNEVYKILKR